MRFDSFSRRQLEALTWWSDSSPYRDYDAIICDGAVRSGKTLCMSLSFVCWAFRRFDGMSFGMCGKSIASLRRNVVSVLLPVLGEIGFTCEDRISKNLIEISYKGRTNRFWLFGGCNEASQSLIQGVTLAGILLDEAALMPRSFVEQACARCSVEGSKMWFNCNPDGPHHWFYTEWIQKCCEKHALYLHFDLRDNPTLSPGMISRYCRMYSGTFYRRFILGEWAATEGRVYDFFDETMLCNAPHDCTEYVVSCDYGTANPTSMGLWGKCDGIWYRLREYYYDSRAVGSQKTDEEYAGALDALVGARKLRCVVVDPSAASFIELLRRRGYPVVKAENDVLRGIRLTADMLRRGDVRICRGCDDSVREFDLYCWKEGHGEHDEPVKRNDHAMDDIRYFCTYIANEARPQGLAAVWVERQ